MVTTYLVGLFVLWAGIFTFFTSAAATVWGKRIMYVTSSVALLGLNTWGFFTKVSHSNFKANQQPLSNTATVI